MRRLRILIVDDHPIVLTGLKDVLQRHYPKSLIVTIQSLSALEAILLGDHFDLTVMDVNFPDGSVFNLLRKFRKNLNLGKLVFLSAKFLPQDINSAVALGASAVLSKFESSETIVKYIDRALLNDVVFSEVIDNQFDMRSHGPLEKQTNHLTPRELEVLVHLAKGGATKEIAKRLYISPKTVDRHRCNIMEKLNIHSQIELSHFAIREGIIRI